MFLFLEVADETRVGGNGETVDRHRRWQLLCFWCQSDVRVTATYVKNTSYVLFARAGR
jgi:hypothetical protein